MARYGVPGGETSTLPVPAPATVTASEYSGSVVKLVTAVKLVPVALEAIAQ
jgi:hypothetical protein